MKCADTHGAQAFCPVRSKALKKWINSTKHVSIELCLLLPPSDGSKGLGRGRVIA